jgi:hypothetical protein
MSKLPEVGMQSAHMSSEIYSKVACNGLSVMDSCTESEYA